jgi:integrase
MPRRNPVKGKNVRAAKDSENRTVLNLDQIDAVLQASREHDEQAPKDELRRIGREAMMTLLITGGLRIDELFAARRRDVDLRGGRLHIPDAKTKAGVRAVQLSPYCLGVLKAYMGRALTQGADEYLFPSSRNHSGERKLRKRDDDRYRDRIFARALRRADELLSARGHQPIPRHPAHPERYGITPHGCRRTWATMQAERGESGRWCMSQIGHEDSRMLWEVYAQVDAGGARARGDARLTRYFGPLHDPTGTAAKPRSKKATRTT